MNQEIRNNLENLINELSEKKISKLKKLIENNELSDSINPFELRSKLSLTNDETKTVQNVLKSNPNLQSLKVTLDLLLELKELKLNHEKNNSLVWTSPFVFDDNAENTDTVILELIHSAKKSIHIIGYTIEPDTKEIFNALEKMSKQGISVKLFFDHAEKFQPLIHKMWNDKGTLPEIYAFKSKNLKNSSLHAKVIIVDGDELLITSANLTGRGISRNLEIGIRHKGNSAKKAEKLVKTLVDNEYLVKI